MPDDIDGRENAINSNAVFYERGYVDRLIMENKTLNDYFNNFLKMTRSLDEHPENYDGPCECETCQSYMIQDC